MAISMDELMRAFGRPMNPNVQPVQDMRIQGMPAQPASAPMAAPMQAAPAPAPQQQRGLLGGFFGPEGRDARARLAIGLEGMTLNPNQALIGQLQQGIESRETAAQKNATVEWLRSRGRDDLAAAIEGGLPAADALRMAIEPGAGAERGVVVGGNVVNPLTGEVIYQGPAQTAPDMTPAAFKALDLQAQAAGYAPGTPEYQEFMATRGAGLVAEAKAVGAARGETAAGAGAKAALASQIELQVNDLLTDPYLPEMVGPMASRLPNVTADAARVQSKMDQILGGAFLQARQLLKGGGAITDFESQKAEQAFIRMNAAQNEADFRKAMTDFRDAVTAGLPKLDSAETAAPPAGGNRIRYDENGNRIE